jgi:hypothetical protein
LVEDDEEKSPPRLGRSCIDRLFEECVEECLAAPWGMRAALASLSLLGRHCK